MTDPEIRGPINGSSPEPCRQSDLATALGRTLHRPSWLPVPAWALRLGLRDQSTLLIGSRRVVPKRALAAGYAFEHPAIDEALADVLG